MFIRLILAILCVTLLGGAVLQQRQQRLDTMHEMARIQIEMDEMRQQTWDLQVRINQQLEPDNLRRAIRRSGLELRPPVPEPNVGPEISGRIDELFEIEHVSP